MMLFKEYHVYPMILGIKIYTRRFWKKPRAKVGSTHLCKLKMFDENSYFGELTVEQLYRQPLGQMTSQDAYLEGGYSLPMYQLTLESIANKPWSELCEMDSPYVVKFRFRVSDIIDPNGGDYMLEEYRKAWMKHLREVAHSVGMLDEDRHCGSCPMKVVIRDV